MLTKHEINQLTQQIKKQINPNSKLYGRLLEWSDITNHYGIGLSDDYLFSTGEFLAILETSNYKLKLTPCKALEGDLVIEILIYALDYFKTWHYGLLGWNCEHYARLVATNEALSYQVKLYPLAFLNNGGYNPDAVRVFSEYLQKLGVTNSVKNS